MFKKSLIFSLFVFLLSMVSLPLQKAQANNYNLIENYSVEVADENNNPLDWHNNSWGQLQASFIYQDNYQRSIWSKLTKRFLNLKSLRVEVSNYNSGDAKWYFEPVDILSGTSYYFSDIYQSSVQTEVVVRYTLKDDSFAYSHLGYVGSSGTWRRSGFVFQTPLNAKKVTIFHLINSDGFLQADKFILKKAKVATITDNVPNNSLEQISEISYQQPLDWQNNSWGENQSKFSYIYGGYTTRRAIKTEITSYSSGDAKWYYTPQPIVGGQTFQFTNYYQSNISSRVVLQVTKTDGSIQYLGLKTASPAANWAKYSDTFTTPVDSKTLTVFHLISSVGYLITDDYSIKSFVSQGFDRPILTMTFDDGWEVNYSTLLPKLNQYGYKITQYFAVTYIENNPDEQYKVSAFVDAGHEIGSHSITHPFLTQASDAQLQSELQDSQQYLQSLTGQEVKHFATPYGDYDTRVISNIQKYYSSNRNTDAGYNRKESFDVTNIRVQNMTRTTQISEVQNWIDQAKADDAWLVIVYHKIADNPDLYDTTPENFSAQLNIIQQSGISVQTIGQALNEILSQLN